MTRPASGERRRPIWLFRPVKPALDAYALPQDERTHAARRAREGGLPDARDLAELVDWSPEVVWGTLASEAAGRA